MNKKQQEAFDLVATGKNVFITGSSGTGKSFVIQLFKTLYEKQRNIGMTSTTGVSALLIGGTTLHSFLGIGLGEGTAEELAEKIMNNYRVKSRWMKLDTLIIDEVSMLSPVLFNKLNKVAQIVRNGNMSLLGKKDKQKEIPFGGIQLVLTGDFLQLPVINSQEFCFQCDAWKSCIHYTVFLTEIIRQKELDFQSALADIRFGNVTEEAKKLLNSRVGVTLENSLGIKPTRIYTTNADVDFVNEKELDLLNKNGDKEFYQYDLEVEFYEFTKNREQALEKVRKNCLAPDNLQLCIGAQVMLLINLDLEEGLANGSRGVVIRFEADLPVVRFLNGFETFIDYHVWELRDDNQKRQASITQLPLRLCWASTLHKVQGMSLDYAIVDLSNIFEYAMAYVALSRVRTIEGLSIININYARIMAHPKAVEFYRNLEKEK